jgi:predicted MFS family arabinose efflux permease
LGAWITGLVSDQTGSYSASFWIVVVLLGIALVISFFIKKIAPDTNDAPPEVVS